MLRYYSCL